MCSFLIFDIRLLSLFIFYRDLLPFFLISLSFKKSSIVQLVFMTEIVKNVISDCNFCSQITQSLFNLVEL